MSKPGARAARRKKMQNPVGGPHEVTPQEANRLRRAISEPRVLSTLCFSSAGLLAGLATGLNHFPSMGALDAVPQTLLLAAYLGDPHLDMVSGIATAFTGLVIGGCLGFSALSEAKEMGGSVLISTLLTVAAVVLTGNIWLAGLAFLAGHMPVFLAFNRLQHT
jgi:hypothetical protein